MCIEDISGAEQGIGWASSIDDTESSFAELNGRKREITVLHHATPAFLAYQKTTIIHHDRKSKPPVLAVQRIGFDPALNIPIITEAVAMLMHLPSYAEYQKSLMYKLLCGQGDPEGMAGEVDNSISEYQRSVGYDSAVSHWDRALEHYIQAGQLERQAANQYGTGCWGDAAYTMLDVLVERGYSVTEAIRAYIDIYSSSSSIHGGSILLPAETYNPK